MGKNLLRIRLRTQRKNISNQFRGLFQMELYFAKKFNGNIRDKLMEILFDESEENSIDSLRKMVETCNNTNLSSVKVTPV